MGDHFNPLDHPKVCFSKCPTGITGKTAGAMVYLFLLKVYGDPTDVEATAKDVECIM